MKPGAEMVRVSLSEDFATFRQKGRSEVIVANVLGTKRNGDGQPTTLWLDRLVHRPGLEFDGWKATGAISTVLTRC